MRKEMEAQKWRNKVLAALVVVLCFKSAVANEVPCPSDESGKCQIGDSYFYRIPSAESGKGRKMLSLLSQPSPLATHFEDLGLDDLSPGASTRRKMLQSQCSDADTSPDSVVQCTNAVRSNPTAFDYPCGGRPSWLSELSPLGALQINSVLSSIAQGHAQYLTTQPTVTHFGPDGLRVAGRAENAGYSYRAIGENVAAGQRSARDVVLSWMCSAGHRRNIMSCDFGEIGVGVAGSGQVPYYTQDFGCQRGANCGCGGSSGQSNPSQSPSQQFDPFQNLQPQVQQGFQQQPQGFQQQPQQTFQQVPQQGVFQTFQGDGRDGGSAGGRDFNSGSPFGDFLGNGFERGFGSLTSSPDSGFQGFSNGSPDNSRFFSDFFGG